MRMKMSFVISMLGMVVLGYLCGKLLFPNDEQTTPAFQDAGIVYFLQQGVYSSFDSMKENVKNLSDYLYQEEDGKYYVYFGITTKEENAKKVKEVYEENNMPTYIKAMVISNPEFLNTLIQYDILLASTETKEGMESVLKAILSSYKEFVIETK